MEEEVLGGAVTRFGEVGVPVGEERVASAVLKVELDGKIKR